MVKPLVSVITATRDRVTDLKECIRQVRAQSYRPIHHYIVSDGPDAIARAAVAMAVHEDVDGPRLVPITFQETGRCWSDEFPASPGAAAWQVAQLLGQGPLQMWLSDDENMDVDHIQLLVDLLEAGKNDFVYSKTRWYTAPEIAPRQDRVIGRYPPIEAEITNCLYRTELLAYGKFETGMGRVTDWHQIKSWMDAGAKYAMLDKVTFSHRADQVGGTFPNIKRPRLRGHR